MIKFCMPHTKMIAQSSRLLLCPWQVDDADDFYHLSLDPIFSSYLITDYRQESPTRARDWIEQNSRQYKNLGKWAVRLNSSGELIGMGGLTPWSHAGRALVDITYRLRQSAIGMGYGRELAELLLSYATKENIHNLSATITPDNLVSIKMIEKLGFRLESRIELYGVETLLYLK